LLVVIPVMVGMLLMAEYVAVVVVVKAAFMGVRL
jgi:hypothetical protein